MKTVITFLVAVLLNGVVCASYEKPEVRLGKIGDKKVFCMPVNHDLTKTPDWTPGKPLPVPLEKLQDKVRSYVHKFLAQQGEKPLSWYHTGSDILSYKGSQDTKWIFYVRYSKLKMGDYFWVAVTLDGKVFPISIVRPEKTKK